jgi:hypothetical protein
MNKPTPLKKALSAAKEAMGPQRYQAGDKLLVCKMCGGQRFKAGGYIPILNVHKLLCGECTHVEFFETLPKVSQA